MYFHSKVGHEFSGSPAPHLSYIVCSTPRCGSSVFCEALCNTQLAGAPTEYFDKARMDRFWQHWNVESMEQYFEALLNKKTSPNGVFGAKAHLFQYGTAFGFDALPTQLPDLHFIWVTRNDSVAQAVSYTKAVQQDLWTHGGNAGNDRELVYEFEQIKQFHDRIERENGRWNKFFEQQNLRPHVVVYEEFSLNLLACIEQVLGFLGVDQSDDFSIEPITLVKQADEVSTQWCDRFRNDL